MISYVILTKHPGLFKQFTGLTVGEFDKLQRKVAPIWTAAEQKRLKRPNRQRAPGGGRTYALDLQRQLLMTLMWLQLSLNTAALGFLFGVNKSTVSRNARRMLSTLEKLDNLLSNWPEPPSRGQSKNIEQAFEAYPDLRLIMTECNPPPRSVIKPVQQPLLAGPSLGRAKRLIDPTQLLAQTPPFQGLPPAELQIVAQAASPCHIERQSFFFHQGDRASTFYILVKGQVRLAEVTLDGHQLLVRFVSPGGAIGMIAAIENSVYPLSAQALEDCQALAWSNAVLEHLMERFPRIAINGLRLVSQRWHELEERYRELATERVEQRIAQTLLRLIHQVGKKVDDGILIDLPLTRQDLAEMTGATLYTISRIVSRWEHTGLVGTRRERLVVRYPHGLTRIAENMPPESPANPAD